MSGDAETGQAGVETPLNRPAFNLRTTKITKETGSKDLFGLLCGTLCCYLPCALLTLAIVNAFSIFLIVIGAMYKDDCSGAPNTGIMLIAMGALAIALSIVESCIRTMASKNIGADPEAPPPPPSGLLRFFQLLDSLIKLAKFGVFIYLCVLVYGLYSEVDYYSPGTENYCNKTLFLVSFWTLTITFIILGLVLLCFACCCCCIIAAAADK